MATGTKKFFAVFLLVFTILSIIVAQSIQEKIGISTEITSLENNVFTTKYGNLKTKLDGSFFIESGFDWGDIVEVSFLGKTLSLPLVSNFTMVDSGSAAVRVEKNASGNPINTVVLGVNVGDFTDMYKIAYRTVNSDDSWFWTPYEDVVFPICIKFSMGEKQGYLAEYLSHDLVMSTDRSDYPNLNDEQYANFRKVNTTGMHGNLFRTSHPARVKNGRNVQADEACRRHGVTIALNLTDARYEAQERPEFSGSFYSTIDVQYVPMSMNLLSEANREVLVDGLRYMAQNSGTYVIHCNEGKDRTGFVIAILECLMGATADEVVDDYMETYYNFYGIDKGSEKFQTIADSNIIKTLKTAFGLDDIYNADLSRAAEDYLLSLGMSSDEISKLKSNL